MSINDHYRLALDINTSAIGLATYFLDAKKQPYELAHVDVRVFGEPLADEKTGKVKKTLRREKRLMRRQTQRRAQRLKKVTHLFPLVGVNSDEVRREQDCQADGGVHAWRAKAVAEKIALARLMVVFLLMAKNRGYEGRFTKKEDGKVKGYISEVESLMEKHGCDTLGQLLYVLKNDSTSHKSVRAWKKVSETGTYAHRDMLKKEFCTIWEKQKEHHPTLKRTTKDDERISDMYERYFKTDEAKKRSAKSIIPRPQDEDISLYELFRMAIFDQRPIWWDKETIGKCELEPKHPRAPKAHPVFQTYRIEQTLNDLQLRRRAKQRLTKEEKGRLTEKEKDKLRPLFDKQKNVSANKIYTKLGIENDRFTHDRSKQHGVDSHEFLGNKTKCVIDKLEKDADIYLSERERGVFIQLIADIDEPSVFEHEQWVERGDVSSYFDASTYEEKQNVVEFINTLKDKIQTVAKMGLDTRRADYSVKAMERLLPLMKEGKRPDEAIKCVYPNKDKEDKKHDISRVGDSVVQQALRETMRAIDYAIHKHGGQLPKQVVVELSRDMKLPKKRREEIEAAQKAKKKARDKAWEELKKVCGAPSETMCKKYILWQEQNKKCVYCGQDIALKDVCYEVEIDHIVPKAYGGQNYRANLAAVCGTCNQEKKGRLPLEAFGRTENENAIYYMSKRMERPSYLTKPFDAYKNDAKRRAKILLIKDRDDCNGDFKLRQNSETAWIGKELTAYLKKRFNINITDKEKLEDRVYVTRGTLTGYMRRHLGLNTLVADIRKDEGKPVFNRKGKIMDDDGGTCGSWHNKYDDYDDAYDKRSDHRHHAVDAAVVGLVDNSTFMKATKHYKVTKNKYNEPTLKGFETQIDLVRDEKSKEKLRKTLHNRLYNYVVWHKPDRHPIAKFFDENLYRVEPKTKKLIKRKKLEELVKGDFDSTIKSLDDLIVGEDIKAHIIQQFEKRYSRISKSDSSKKEKEKYLKEALCGKDKDDGIYYPVGTKNKVKRVRMYHKVGRYCGKFKKKYDKRITMYDVQHHLHVHALNNVGYACFEIVKDQKGKLGYKPIPYHVYWTKEYQACLQNEDGVVRIYKNDTLYDKESKEFYTVKELPASQMQLRCIKTTETLTYDDANKKIKEEDKKLTKSFVKGEIPNIRLIKSRSEIASIKSDIRNTNESPSNHSD